VRYDSSDQDIDAAEAAAAFVRLEVALDIKMVGSLFEVGNCTEAVFEVEDGRWSAIDWLINAETTKWTATPEDLEEDHAPDPLNRS
jgi:hypothetical protein